MAFQAEQVEQPQSAFEAIPGAKHRTHHVDADARRPLRQSSGPLALAQFLGWFSIALGASQILAPGAIARLTGLRNRPGLIRALGLREIVTGIGILASRRPASWLWARVAGDAMDLAILGKTIGSRPAKTQQLATSTAAVSGVTALDCYAARQLSQQNGHTKQLRLRKTCTINCKPEEAYQFWHNFENLPRFMKHLEEVRKLDDKRSFWVSKAPADTRAEWIAETVEDRPNEAIAWRSLSGVHHAGSVRFEPASGGRGTVVTVEMEYDPPGGALASYMAMFFGEEPSQQIDEDLRRFKALLETGEIPTTKGQPAGAGRAKKQGLGKFDKLARG